MTYNVFGGTLNLTQLSLAEGNSAAQWAPVVPFGPHVARERYILKRKLHTQFTASVLRA